MPIFFTKKSCNRGDGTTPQMPLTVHRKENVPLSPPPAPKEALCKYWYMIYLNKQKVVYKSVSVFFFKWIRWLVMPTFVSDSFFSQKKDLYPSNMKTRSYLGLSHVTSKRWCRAGVDNWKNGFCGWGSLQKLRIQVDLCLRISIADLLQIFKKLLSID